MLASSRHHYFSIDLSLTISTSWLSAQGQGLCAGPSFPPQASGCHAATADPFTWVLPLNYYKLAWLRALRAVGHAPYVLGRKALVAQGGCLSVLQPALLSGGSFPNAWPQMHRKQKPGTQRCQCHAHTGPACQLCHPAFVASGNFQPGNGKKQRSGKPGAVSGLFPE